MGRNLLQLSLLQKNTLNEKWCCWWCALFFKAITNRRDGASCRFHADLSQSDGSFVLITSIVFDFTVQWDDAMKKIENDWRMTRAPSVCQWTRNGDVFLSFSTRNRKRQVMDVWERRVARSLHNFWFTKRFTHVGKFDRWNAQRFVVFTDLAFSDCLWR